MGKWLWMVYEYLRMISMLDNGYKEGLWIFREWIMFRE